MMTEKLQQVLNEQVTAELWSANLYLSMSFYLEREGYTGFAAWMKRQSQEETEHAYAIANHIMKRGGIAKVDKIDVVPTGFGTPLEIFQHAYEHECHVSKMIDLLITIAASEK
ncbi:ferritin, partial [Streptococcus pneumoniae]